MKEKQRREGQEVGLGWVGSLTWNVGAEQFLGNEIIDYAPAPPILA